MTTPEPMTVAALKLPRRLLHLVDEAAREGYRTRSKQLLRYVINGLRADGKLTDEDHS